MIRLIIDHISLDDANLPYRKVSWYGQLIIDRSLRESKAKSRDFKIFIDTLPNDLDVDINYVGEILVNRYTNSILRQYINLNNVDIYLHPISRELILAGKVKALLGSVDNKYAQFYKIVGDAIYDNYLNLTLATLISNLRDREPNTDLIIIKNAKHFFNLKHYLYRYNLPFEFFIDCDSAEAVDIILRISNQSFSSTLSGLVSQFRLRSKGNTIGDKINKKDEIDLPHLFYFTGCGDHFNVKFHEESVIHIPQSVDYYFRVFYDYWQSLHLWFDRRSIPVPSKYEAFYVFNYSLFEAKEIMDLIDLPLR